MRRPQPATARQTNPTPNVAVVKDSLSPEAEIASLTEVRAGLAVQLVPLERAKADAILHRRNILLTGGADEAATVEANRVCRERESDWYAIHDAILEADRRLAAATERRDAAAMEAERQRVAEHLERNAGEIQTVAASLVKAIGEVEKLHALLNLTISGRAAGQFDPLSGVAGPAEVASAILLQGLANTMPGVEIVGTLKPWSRYSLQERIEGADPAAIASEFAERLRDTASKVRAQEIDHDLPVHQEAMPAFHPATPEAEIFVLAPFFYTDRRGERRMVSTPQTLVPVPVAERAIEIGVASDTQTSEWRAKYRNKDRGSIQSSGSQVHWADCADLGLDLSAIHAADIERQRTAWLERQAQAAA